MRDHGVFAYSNYREGLPYVNQPDFISELQELIKAEGIDYIYPAFDSVVLALAEHQDRLDAKVIGSPLETCRLAISKSATYETLEDVIRVPHIYSPSQLDDLEWPVFLKPDQGYGAKGTSLAHSADEVRYACERNPDLLICENLPGEEFTVECFTDRHGKLRFCGGRKRRRIANGISVNTKSIQDRASLQSIAEKINGAVTFRGAWFFQVKRAADGELALLEIAARIPGSMALYRNKGVNLALLSLYDAMDLDVDIMENTFCIEMDRALGNRFRIDYDYRSLYLDYDDCVIFGPDLNPEALALIAKAKNRKIPVTLVSRHNGDLHADLELRGIRQLFDEIIHITDGKAKSSFITGDSPIFIDDAHSERAEVFRTLGIPVFAPDALECLI